MTGALRVVAALGAAAIAVTATAGDACAGGLTRAIGGSPASAGLAGAFTAVADDAYALNSNPAGLAFAAPGILAALELVVAPRSYVPVDADGNEGPAQDARAIAPVPVVGATFRVSPTLVVGVGAWNASGGSISWDPLGPGVPAVQASSQVVFELASGVGWAVNDRVALGAALRLGVGLFAVESVARPVDSELSAFGVGVGATAGVTIRATDTITVAAGWRSNLDVNTTGSGELNLGGSLRTVDVEQVQRWPQAVSLGVALTPSDRLLLTAQLDWAQWSRFETLEVDFPGGERDPVIFDLDWRDTITARAGARYAVSPTLSVGGGVLFDTSAVPDRTIERQYTDLDKLGLALGASIGLSDTVILDVTASATGGLSREVPVTSVDGWTAQEPVAPGTYESQVLTLTSGVRIAL